MCYQTNKFRNYFSAWALVLAAAVLFSGKALAQGFLKTYPSNSPASGVLVDVTPDGYCVVGSSGSALGAVSVFQNLSTDVDGNQTALSPASFGFHLTMTWRDCGQLAYSDKVWGPGNFQEGFSVTRAAADSTVLWRDTLANLWPNYYFTPKDLCFTPNGEIVVAGVAEPVSGSAVHSFIAKLDPDGNVLWYNEIPNPDPSNIAYWRPYKLTATPDGGVLVHVLSQVNDSYLLKLTDAGAVQWLYQPSSVYYAIGSQAPDGHMYVGEISVSPLQSTVHKIAPDGTEVLTVDVEADVPTAYLDFVFATSDNGFLVAGVDSMPSTPNFNNPFLARYDANGNLLWKKIFLTQPYFTLDDAEELPGGGFVLTGSQNSKILLLKIDDIGNIQPNEASGNLVLDANADCLADAGETPLADWIVQVTALGQVYYATTDAAGHFFIDDLPAGPYSLTATAVPPSYVWAACAPMVLDMPVTNNFTLEFNMAAQKLADCPVMTVDLAMANLRRCVQNHFYVYSCNDGSALAENATLQLILPAEMSFVSASSPGTVSGQEVLFELGDVAVGECAGVQVTVLVDCDSTQLGQSLCVEAHVTPDSFCTQPANWSGACIEVAGRCEGDSVYLTLKNTGAAQTSQSLEYLIIDDDVVMLMGQLPAGFPQNSQQEMAFAADGSTLRLSSEQEPNHPLPGNPSVAVEGCAGWNLGFVTPFSNLTGNPFSDLECREIIGSYDPNEKQAFPKGVHNEHFIEPGTPLTYVLHFQNTGTDTAFRVVLRDTLSALLDPASVRVGAASHPYTWSLEGHGVLVFTFDPIALPDSNVNWDASNGFVQFGIQMRDNVPLGSVLSNRAGIYFDQNEVVMTNTVTHTIDRDFLEINLISTGETLPEMGASIYPNPAVDVVQIRLRGENAALGTSRQLLLTDAFGKLVLNQTLRGSSAELHRNGLPSGVYFVKIVENERVVGNGKVIWR